MADKIERAERANQVFAAIIEAMCTDNCCTFKPTDQDVNDAMPHIALLLDAGFFWDVHDGIATDLESDVWMAAAGEFTEAPDHFSKRPAAYAALSEVLDRIFNSYQGED